MKFSYAIDPQRRMIFQSYSGRFTVTQVISCIRQLWDDPAYDRTFHGIADLTKMETGAGIEDLHTLLDFLRASDARTSIARWAFVADSPLITACSLFYKQHMRSIHQIDVFSTWEAAGAWLHWRGPMPELPTRDIDVV